MITLTKKECNRAWAGLRRVVSKRLPRPVGDHVLVTVDNTGASFTATDLEQQLTVRLDADAAGEGRFLLPVAELRDLARGRGDEEVQIGSDGPGASRVVTAIDGQELSRSLPTPPVDDWPDPLPAITTAPLDLASLIAAYRRALVAASTDPSRIVLGGVLLDAKVNAVVATDGHRLLRVGLDGIALPADAILPRSKVLDSDLLAGKGQLGIETETDQPETVRLIANGWDYRVRQIAGVYPNYPQVIPDTATYPITLAIAAEDVAVAKAACGQFPDEPGPGVVLYADDSAVALLHAIGDRIVHVRLPRSRARTAEPIALYVNRDYLLDGLASDCTRLRLADPTKPVVGEGPGRDCYVLMPLRDAVTADIYAYTRQHLQGDPAVSVSLPTPVAVPPTIDPAVTTARQLIGRLRRLAA